jgi:glycosyltransferase involved in cell wall biosynthesis
MSELSPSASHTLLIVLPVFNEADGIQGFLNELHTSLQVFKPYFILVDDASTDSTNAILGQMENSNFPLSVITNKMNSGHGYSVIKGLTSAIGLSPNRVVLCDGDGQFDGADVRALVQTHIDNPKAIIEGARFGRDTPWFRRLISRITCTLVWTVTKERPRDANTPLRVFPNSELKRLLTEIPANCLVPNLAFSCFSRVFKFPIIEIQVKSYPPRRQQTTQDQWRQRINFLPSGRFLKFVSRASKSWAGIALHCRQVKSTQVNR